MDELGFSAGSVPVAVAARIFSKDPSWIRAGIISGWLPIGIATRDGVQIVSLDEMDSRYGRINFYISPKKLWEITGFIWKKFETENDFELYLQALAKDSGFEIVELSVRRCV